MTKLKRPEAVNLDRFSRRGVKQSDSFEFAILQAKRMNATVSKVAPSEVIHDQRSTTRRPRTRTDGNNKSSRGILSAVQTARFKLIDLKVDSLVKPILVRNYC